MKSLNKHLKGIPETIFSVITRMANSKKALNFAQGFPENDGPIWMKEIAQKSIMEGPNQYGPSHGDKLLREEISKNYLKYHGVNYNSDLEITVATGASEPLFNSIQALCNPEDEFILVSPVFNLYPPIISLCGGKSVEIAFNEKFEFPIQDLKKKINTKTKCLILNFPHNPSGKILSELELKEISKVCIENDIYIISDEVYEYLTYPGIKQRAISSLPGMKERTIVISSASKTLSFTGWRVGWSLAPKEISEGIRTVHQFNSFNGPMPLQSAVGNIMSLDDGKKFHNYILDYQNAYLERKNLMEKILKEKGYKIIPPQGGFFILCNFQKLAEKLSVKTDQELCIRLIEDYGFATIPLSSFYLNISNMPKDIFLRFCFAKEIETIKKLNELLPKSP